MIHFLGISIDPESRIPKYKQIYDAVVNNIALGKFQEGGKLPSINELSEQLLLSRDTVEKAYGQLKSKNIIESVKGKGYYLCAATGHSKKRVFFMVNKASSYKMIIYNAFVSSLGSTAVVDLLIYHCEELLFIDALEKVLGKYDYYVIMPHFKDAQLHHQNASIKVLQTLEKIPKKQLIIMDNHDLALEGAFGAIYQNFETDLFEALEEALEKLKKYDQLILVYPEKSIFPYPKGILKGFQKFCSHHHFKFEVLDTLYEDMEFESKDVYVLIEEADLVNLMQQVKSRNLRLGQDLGVISYNETPLKELLGINVISTRFKAMGETAAYMILKDRLEKTNNVFEYIERNSL